MLVPHQIGSQGPAQDRFVSRTPAPITRALANRRRIRIVPPLSDPVKADKVDGREPALDHGPEGLQHSGLRNAGAEINGLGAGRETLACLTGNPDAAESGGPRGGHRISAAVLLIFSAGCKWTHTPDVR